jgi:hypothetical protein
MKAGVPMTVCSSVGDAEVDQLEATGVREEHVLRLHVAVDDGLVVRGGEHVEQRFHHLRRLHQLERPLLGDAFLERLAVEPLDHEERSARVGDPVLQRVDHPGVAHQVGDAPVAEEALDHHRVVHHLLAQDLHRRAPPVGMGGGVHVGRAAAAEDRLEPPRPAEKVADARGTADRLRPRRPRRDHRRDARRALQVHVVRQQDPACQRRRLVGLGARRQRRVHHRRTDVVVV